MFTRGNPDAEFAATSYSDIARWLPKILLDPACKNAHVNVCSQVVTFQEAVNCFEEAAGEFWLLLPSKCGTNLQVNFLADLSFTLKYQQQKGPLMGSFHAELLVPTLDRGALCCGDRESRIALDMWPSQLLVWLH